MTFSKSKSPALRGAFCVGKVLADSPILLSRSSVGGAAAFSRPKIEGFEKRDGGC